MSRLLILIALAGLIAGPVVLAQDADALATFEEGNRLYAEGAYAEAVERYRSVEERGVVSSALYYNMGHAYFRLNRLGYAILYYERARRLRPGDPDLRHSLAVARSRTDNQITRIPDPVWVVGWNRVVAALGVRGLYAIGLLFYLLTAGLIARRIWFGTPNDWIRRGIFVGIVGGAVFLGAAFWASVERASARTAVVLDTRAALHETADADADESYEVREGLVVDVLAERPGWFEVRLPNGATGWIAADAVAEV